VKVLVGHDAAVAAWVARHIPGCERGWQKPRALGVVNRDGFLVGGMVYHDWNPEAGVIEISGASVDRRWLSRGVLTTLLEYPFSFCQMIVGRHDPDGPARRWWAAVGADEVLIPRLRGRDRDAIISTLTVEQWAASPFNANNGGRHEQAERA
jgi:hypothetical protein